MSAGHGTAGDRSGGADLDRVLAGLSGVAMAATVGVLAADVYTGRRVGTPGGAAARSWLTTRLTELGATTATDAFPVPGVPDLYRAPRVVWGDGRAERHLTFGRDAAVHLTSADRGTPVRGALGVAGVHDPGGRWLVVPAGMALPDAYPHATGACGLLLARDVDPDGWQYTVLGGDRPGVLPILTISTGIHRAMGDAAAADGGWLSGNTPIRRVDVTGTNVYARLADGAPDLLLTAHYDGVGDHPGLRQPGAADNASGVAVILEVARALAPALPAGVGFSIALLDAEEVGARGSAHHAAQLRAAGAGPWVVNVDGVGLLDGAAAVEAGGPAHGLLAVLDQAGRYTGVPLRAGPVASDNRRYAAAGFPAVGIGAGMAGYHSPADTADLVEPDTLLAVARLVAATGWLAVTAPTTLQSLIGDRR